MHKRRRRSNQGNAAGLEMTPMIDVVFLLLVFFVVTVKPTDLLAKLDVSRPAAPTTTDDFSLLRIDVGTGGYVVNGRRLTLDTLRKRLHRVYKTSPRTTLVVASTAEASHSKLIKLLNMCAAENIKNISLMSL
jgi:biopolymer transport protein ExbD